MATTQTQVIDLLTRYQQHQWQATDLLNPDCNGLGACLADGCQDTDSCGSDCTCACNCPTADQATAKAQVHAMLAQAAIDAAKLIASLA